MTETTDAITERLRWAVDALRIGMFDWELVSNRIVSSLWFEELWGFKPGEFSGAKDAFLDRVHSEDRPGVVEEISRCISSRASFASEFRVVWPDGSVHWLLMQAEFSSQASGRPLQLCGVVMDISQRKQHEDALREARRKAEDANRFKSDFLANMSHEIRTPLSAIMGMTYLALRSRPNLRQQRYLTKISNAAESLLGITNDILDFSKIEAGKLELERIPFGLDDVLNNVNDIVNQKAKQKGIEVVFSVARGAPRRLLGDPLRLGQILINLLNNAIKFTDQGEVVVKVVATPMASDRAVFEFSVSDTGIGMSADQVSNLFQSFNQADSSITRRYGGTGLGLSISKQLSKLMGGTFEVESELGRGSTFRFTATFDTVAIEPPSVLCAPLDDLKKSILVFDNDEDARMKLISILYKNGFVADSASTAWEALSALSSASRSGKPFDLVIMDWRLPGIGGIENSRRVKAHLTHARMPAILMVSESENEEVMGGISDPTLDAFLVKPVDEALLIDAIAKIFIANRAGTDPGVQSLERTAPAQLTGRRVLLVEDNEINRELAVELLEALGIMVIIANNGQEGVQRAFTEPCDLVLMDIQMPEMDGLMATRLIRTDPRLRDLPIVAMTAHAMTGDREKSLDAGMNDHLTKPISPEKLKETLLRWIPAGSADRTTLVAVEARTAVTQDYLPAVLPPFNIQVALARTNGKPELLRRIMFGFREKYANAPDELRQLIADGQMGDAERLAHSLRGLAATLAADGLAGAASAVECRVRDGQTANMSAFIDRIQTEMGPAIAAIDSLVRE